jgi:hypothetical protein
VKTERWDDFRSGGYERPRHELHKSYNALRDQLVG